MPSYPKHLAVRVISNTTRMVLKLQWQRLNILTRPLIQRINNRIGFVIIIVSRYKKFYSDWLWYPVDQKPPSLLGDAVLWLIYFWPTSTLPVSLASESSVGCQPVILGGRAKLVRNRFSVYSGVCEACPFAKCLVIWWTRVAVQAPPTPILAKLPIRLPTQSV